MYRKQKRIPTIVALLILFAGIGSAVYFDQSSKTFFSKAQQTADPLEVHFTNISQSSMTVSWLTAKAVTGIIEVASPGQDKHTLLDDLDSDNVSRVHTTHYINLQNLTENTLYQIKIISGNGCENSNSCPVYQQKTSVKMDAGAVLPPAHGTIKSAGGNAVERAVVYLLVGKSLPLSTRTDSLGNYVIPLNNLRSQDLLSRPEIADNDIVQINAFRTPSEKTDAVIDVKSIRQNLTIPEMNLGNSYNFIDLISKKDQLSKSNQLNILGVQNPLIQATTAPPDTTSRGSIDFIFPKYNEDTTSDNRPRIKGTAPPNTQLLIVINSYPQKGQITVGPSGTWTWRPPQNLPPGVHHVSIQGYDQNGNIINIIRRFIVLKSGEQVLGESTPSASLTPDPTETPVVTPVVSPTISKASPTPSLVVSVTSAPSPTTAYPSSTPSITPPPTGNSNVTLYLIGASGFLLLAGLKLLI